MALKSSNKAEENNVYELVVTVDAKTFSDACKKHI